MFRSLVVASCLSCLLLLGCRGEWPFGKAAEPAANAAPPVADRPSLDGEAELSSEPATPPEDEAGTEAGAEYVITAQRLDRYIKYQDKTLKLYAEMMAALDDVGQVADAGSGAGAAPIQVIRRHARAQERARKQVGLSARDVHELERVVGDVISRRAMAEALVTDAPVQEIETLAARLPPEQRGELVRTLENLKKREQETRTLAEERKKYGDANVDQVLTREQELTRQWNQAIATFAGTRGSVQAAAAGGMDVADEAVDAGIVDGQAPAAP